MQSTALDKIDYAQHSMGVAEVGGSAGLSPLQLSYSFCINTLFCACCLAVEGTLEVSCRAVRSKETETFMISARSGARR